MARLGPDFRGIFRIQSTVLSFNTTPLMAAKQWFPLIRLKHIFITFPSMGERQFTSFNEEKKSSASPRMRNTCEIVT